MSSDIFLFGTYQTQNTNYDPNLTADSNSAKWRSQYLVDSNSTLELLEIDDQIFWVLLPSSTKVIFISDLQYQLRNDDLNNYNYIHYASNPGIYDYYCGSQLEITAKYDPSVFVADNAINPNDDPFPKPQSFPKPLIEPGFIRFAETILELGYDYGAVGGPKFNTEIIAVADETEQRSARLYLPLGRWQLGDRFVADSQLDKLEEVTYLKKFHSDRLGSLEGFRFRDWADYQGKNELIAVGDGTKTHYQLRKGYWAGDVVTYRPIQKPVGGTVKIYVDGVLVADWQIDYINGVISHSTPLANGAKLSASFEFDVPVWFENDEISFNLEAYYPDTKVSVYRLQSVFVVEGKIPLSLPWKIEPLPKITKELNLGQIPGTIEKYIYSTSKVALKSGYVRRADNRTLRKLSFDLGNCKLDQLEVDKILGYFYCAKGKVLDFPFLYQDKQYKIRFDQDNLNFKFEAAMGVDSLFSLSGLKLHLEEKPLFKLPPNTVLLDKPIFIDPKDPNNFAINSSNPSSGSGKSAIKPFSLSAFVPINFDFVNAAPTIDPTRKYLTKAFWWAGGQLHLILQGSNLSTGSNNGKNRLFYYQLNPGDWTLTYIESDISDYVSLQQNPLIASTATGTCVFGQAKYQPKPTDTLRSGLLKFEVDQLGGTNLNFYQDPTGDSFGLAKLLVGDRLFLSKFLPSKINQLIHRADGIEYVNNKYDANVSNPINHSLEESVRSSTDSYLNREEKGNVWATDTIEGDSHKVRYYPESGKEEILLEYISEHPTNKPYIWRWQNESGQLLVIIITEFAVSIQRTYLKNNQDWLLIDKIEIPNVTTDATRNLADVLSFASNSGKFSFDSFGNTIGVNKNKTVYCKSGSGFAIDITPQVGNNLQSNFAPTPYGFVWISYKYSNIFRPETNLYIVQTN